MHRCRLSDGQTGRCRARKNVGGAIVPVNYGHVTSIALDPIEKKPLSRFFPGSMILSVGSFGCNMDCLFCQNDSISMADERYAVTKYISPGELAALAMKMVSKGNIGLAYTYNEPLVGYEYVRDTAIEIHKAGMKNVVVTNGAFAQNTLSEVLPYIDAWNIDLKGFSGEWYKRLGGDLEMVKYFIKAAVECSHVELTTLIVPDENDSPEEMSELSSWVSSVDKRIPLHITRFFPRRDMLDRLPTDIDVLKMLAETAKENLDTVIIGNI